MPLYNGYAIKSIEWIINGSQLEDLNLQNVEAQFTSTGGGLGLLKITAVPIQFNTTEIQCRASFNGGQFTSNMASILIIPGSL